MEPERHIPLGPFCLNVTHGRLWGGTGVGLRLRSLAMLHALSAHPGWLVTKEELPGEVWAGTLVIELFWLQNPDVSQAETCCQQATAFEWWGALSLRV